VVGALNMALHIQCMCAVFLQSWPDVMLPWSLVEKCERPLEASYSVVPQYAPELLWMKGLWWLFSILSLFWKYTSRHEITFLSMGACVCGCVSVCVSPSNNFRMPEPIFTKLRYVYYATWRHVSGVIHKSFTSVIPTLQPLKLLR
jgi:hypothetical protein